MTKRLLPEAETGDGKTKGAANITSALQISPCPLLRFQRFLPSTRKRYVPWVNRTGKARVLVLSQTGNRETRSREQQQQQQDSTRPSPPRILPNALSLEEMFIFSYGVAAF
jgi:hypothetical protein